MLQFLRGVFLLVSNFLPVSRRISKTPPPPGILTAPNRVWARRAALLLALALLPAGAYAQSAYITNNDDGTVSVIDTASNTVTATIPVGLFPSGAAVTPDGTRIYVGHDSFPQHDVVSVIDATSNTVTTEITVGYAPSAIAVTSDGTKAYVVNYGDNTVAVIDTATNKVIGSPIPVTFQPSGVAVTPDGRKVYVPGRTAVSVIDTASNTVTATISVGTFAEGIAITPDGTKAYVPTYLDSTVWVIDTVTDQVTSTIPVRSGPTGIATTPNGSTAYVTLYEGQVVVIDTASNMVTATIPVGNTLNGLGVTLDGAKIYVTNFNDNSVSVIATATNIVVATIPVGNLPGAAGQFIGPPTPRSPPVAVDETKTTTANTPVLIDLTVGARGGKPASAALVGSPGGGTITGFPDTNVSFTPAKDFTGTASFQFTLANGYGASNMATVTITVTPPTPIAYITNNAGGSVSAVNTATNTVAATIPVGQLPYGLAVTPDGTKAYIIDRTSVDASDSRISVIDTASNTVTTTIPVGHGSYGVALTPDGSRAYVTNTLDNTVSVINTASNIVTATISVGVNPVGVAITPDGSKAYVSNNYDNTVSVFNTASNTLTATIPVGRYPYGIAIMPDGSKTYVANSYDNTVSVIGTASNTVTATISVGATPIDVAITPDGTKAYVANRSETTVSVIDTATNTVVGIPIQVGHLPYGIAITPDGSKAYVATSDDNTVSLIDTATNTVIAAIPVGSYPIGVGKFTRGSPPVISSVSPNPVTGSNNPQPFTINGSNFVTGANITLRDLTAGQIFPNRVASSFSSTQIVINPNFTTAADNWSVEIINPDGQSSGQFPFAVIAPAPPVAVAESATTTANTPVTIDLTVGATGSPTSATLVGTPTGGTVSGFPATTVTFTPSTGFSGTASFQFTLANAFGTSNTATATITVTSPPPTAVNETATTNANVPIAIDLTQGATGNPTSAAIVGTPTGGTISGFPATTVTFTPAKNYTGTASFQFTLANAFGTSNTATATITVKGADPNFVLAASAYCNTSPPVAPAVKLSWTPQTGATSYDLYRNGTLYSQNITQTSFDNNENVKAGNSYSYFVVAHYSGASDTESNQAPAPVPANVCPAGALPDLVVQNFGLSSSSAGGGTKLIVKFTIHNQGGGAALPSVTHFRLGNSSSNVTVNDPLLLSLNMPSIAKQGDNAKGDSIDINETLTIPNNLAAGAYYLWIILDTTSSAGQGQVNEQNDKAYRPLTVTTSQGPDLAVTNLNITPPKTAPGGSATLSFSIVNQGSNTANASTTNIYLSSSNSDIGSSAVLLGSPIAVPSLAVGPPGIFKKITEIIPANQAVGDYYVWVKLDANNTAGQSSIAKANDKAYVPLALATDNNPTPLKYCNALEGFIKALLNNSQTLPDLLQAIYDQYGNWQTVGEDLNLLKNSDNLSAAFEWIRLDAIQKNDTSLASEMLDLEKQFNQYVFYKTGLQTIELFGQIGLDDAVDQIVGEKFHHKDWLPVAHSVANTAFNAGLGALYFSAGDEVDAGQIILDQTVGQGILVLQESGHFSDDINNYVADLENSGLTEISLYHDADTNPDPARKKAALSLIASYDAANQDQVNALWNQFSLSSIFSSAAKRPLIAWHIIQELVLAKRAENINDPVLVDYYISKVKSDVSWFWWAQDFIFGVNLKGFANEVAALYKIKAWTPLPT